MKVAAAHGNAWVAFLERLSRYLHGWSCWFEGLYKARTKTHGAGKQPWILALRTASCYRFIADGQHSQPIRSPFYLRSLKSRKTTSNHD